MQANPYNTSDTLWCMFDPSFAWDYYLPAIRLYVFFKRQPLFNKIDHINNFTQQKRGTPKGMPPINIRLLSSNLICNISISLLNSICNILNLTTNVIYQLGKLVHTRA